VVLEKHIIYIPKNIACNLSKKKKNKTYQSYSVQKIVTLLKIKICRAEKVISGILCKFHNLHLDFFPQFLFWKKQKNKGTGKD